MPFEIEIRRSAEKHGIAPEDSITAATTECVYRVPLDGEHPHRELRLGFDSSMRMLEIVILLWDDDTETIILSMKARKQYRTLLD